MTSRTLETDPRAARAASAPVVLLQMGGPDTLDHLEPFLFSIFADPDIIQLPRLLSPLQRPLARLVARRRSVKMRERYARIGNGSPIRRETEAQARLLAAELARRGVDAPVHVAMRYSEPRAEAAVRALADAAEAVLLPLYPHYTRGTTGSSVADLRAAARAAGLPTRLRLVPRWGTHPSYLALLEEQLAQELERARADGWDGPVHLLLSAHGLPRSYVRDGDPYPREVETTAEAVGRAAVAMGYAGWRLGYQSKVGPVEWLRPYTDDVLPELAAAGARGVVAVPLGFVSDHIETLYDLDITYREQAESLGMRYRRVPAFNDDARFVRVLADVLADAPLAEVPA